MEGQHAHFFLGAGLGAGLEAEGEGAGSVLAAGAAVCKPAAEGGCVGGVAAAGLRCRLGSISFAAFALASASLPAAIGMDST